MTKPRKVNINTIPILEPIYGSKHRYIVLYGGRGGGKSFEVARCIICRIASSPETMRVLCCRELQKTVKGSVYAELVNAIYSLGLEKKFELLNDRIRFKMQDRNVQEWSEIVFYGLKDNVHEIKSIAQLKLCWVEEAAFVSEYSWELLIPTIRTQDSQLVLTFNPTSEDSPTYKKFVLESPVKTFSLEFFEDNIKFKNNHLYIEKKYNDIIIHYKKENSLIRKSIKELGMDITHIYNLDDILLKNKIREYIHASDRLKQMYEDLFIPEERKLLININYWDNPYMSDTLYSEMVNCRENDYEKYLHIWEGKPLNISESVIFKGKFKVEEIAILTIEDIDYIQSKKINYKYGMDFGFSTDPFAMVECFIHGECIYITKEIYWHGMENMDIVPVVKQRMPSVIKKNRKIYADSAYPATISQLAKVQIHPSGEKLEALNIKGAVKGKDSVEEGINWLKSFTIIIDPSCKNTIYEFNNYSYMTDKDTGDIIPKVQDANNHLIDALRYAFNEEILASKQTISRVFSSSLERKDIKKRPNIFKALG